jgi:DNA repair photolyase
MSTSSVIYEPQGQAGEYAALATNPYRGCGHGCAYCYVPEKVVKDISRAEFNAGATPRQDFLKRLDRDAAKLRGAYGQTPPQVLLSFTTDPYHPGDTALTREVLIMLHEHGFPFTTLTKGGTRALRDLDLFDSKADSFACTLTCLDEAFSRKWEPQAALPADRLKALWEFHQAGIFTWVSLEPVLDTERTLEIIRATAHMVDLYKVGRANYLPQTKTLDWQRFTQQAVEVLREVGAAHYIKRDLQPFLPAGYPNDKRPPQYHSRCSACGGEDGKHLSACPHWR